MTVTATWAAKSTQGFIDENPSQVVLTRRARVASTAGGWVDGAATIMAAQEFRLVGTSSNRRRLDDQGDVMVPDFTMIGMPERDVKEGDTFVVGPLTYRVRKVNRVPAWATRAEAVEHGPA